MKTYHQPQQTKKIRKHIEDYEYFITMGRYVDGKLSPITLFDQRKWINFFNKHNSNLDMRNIDLSEFVTDKFKSEVLYKIYDELDNVIQSSKNGYGKINGGLENRNN